jgi:UDP-GlcNAc3NAcA epimerase
MKVATVVGARPQFVKAAALSPVLRRRVDEVLIHTGQHYDYSMSQLFFEELHLPEPDHHLEVGSGPHGWQTAEILRRVEEVLIKLQPDCVVVYGDTNTTLAAALAAVKLGLAVAHVEAGMRSFVRSMPEEINRVVTDHVSALLFCPTATAVANLAREGITDGVHQVGDLMADLLAAELPRAAPIPVLERFGLQPCAYVLATVHRAANTDARELLADILSGLAASPDPVLLPLHPRTRAALERFGLHPA